MIKDIVFDIGDVLVGYDGMDYLDSFGFSPEKEKTIFEALFRSPYWPEFDREALSVEELLDKVCALAPAEYRADIIRVFEELHQSLRYWPESIPCIVSLKDRGFGLYYLSNYSSHLFARTREALDFLPYFDGGLFSYEVQQIKPEHAIYQSFLARFPQITAEEAVFIDNNEENVKAAESFGFHGIVFRDRAQAMEELEALIRKERDADGGNGPA